MPSLDTLVAQWAEGLRANHPDVAPHADELADHVSSRAQEMIARGVAVEEAFATALGALGAPSDLQSEFGKNTKVQRRTERRAIGLYLVITFLFTAGVVAIHARYDLGAQVTAWIILVWVLTTSLHDVLLRRARRGLVTR